MLINLKSEMTRNSLTVDDIANALKIHRNSAQNKINGASKFNIEEAFELKAKLFPYADLSFLFKDYPRQPRDNNQAS